MLSSEEEEILLHSLVKELNQPWLTDITVISLPHITLDALSKWNRKTND